MGALRLLCRTLIVAVLALYAPSAAVAGLQTTKSEFELRATEYDHALITPVHATPEQHHLIAVSLAAHHTPSSDLSELLRVLDELAAHVTYLPQSDTSFWWDGIQWNPSTRTSYAYSDAKLTETISQSTGDGVNWVNETRLVDTYDGSGRLATSTSMTWSGGWVNESMTTFTYDGSGNVGTTLSQTWNGSAWVNEFYSEMTYSGSNLATMITQIWSGSAWVNMRKDIYTYSGFGISEVLTQAWTGAWIDAERIVYSYDGSGRRTQQLSQLWRNNSWRNWFKNDFGYDGVTANEILDVRSDWDTVGAAWVAFWADTTRYSSNRRIEMVTAYFTFSFVTRFLYSYDGPGNLTEIINQNGVGSSWMNFSRTLIVYTLAGVFDDERADGMPSGFAVSQNYPNPFNLGTTIPYTLSGDGQVRIAVCNILGQPLATLVDAWQPAGSYHAVWDGRDQNGRPVASGVYFFRAEIGGQTQVRKMVLLK